MQREKAPGAPVFRNEWKHLISSSDRAQLRTRLSAVAYQDPHAIDGRYKIRSLYFDTISDRVLREKIDGVSVREKFRIRYYNDDPSVIFLEKKCKQSGSGYKLQTRLTKEQANRLADVAHDGLARAIRPVHTQMDGDTMFALATGRVGSDVNFVKLCAAAAEVTARAIANAILFSLDA